VAISKIDLSTDFYKSLLKKAGRKWEPQKA
jgi:hypothetical protein